MGRKAARHYDRTQTHTRLGKSGSDADCRISCTAMWTRSLTPDVKACDKKAINCGFCITIKAVDLTNHEATHCIPTCVTSTCIEMKQRQLNSTKHKPVKTDLETISWQASDPEDWSLCQDCATLFQARCPYDVIIWHFTLAFLLFHIHVLHNAYYGMFFFYFTTGRHG